MTDLLLDYMKRKGIPITRENYLDLDYGSDHETLTAEEEADLPEELQVANLTDFNPYHEPGGKPEGGQFTSGDGGTAALVAQGVYSPEDAAKAAKLRSEELAVNGSILPYIHDPENPAVTAKMNELAGLMKDARTLKADPGGLLEGLKQPGGPRDAVVVGGGPAGLAFGINSGYEGLDVLLVEGSPTTGGQSKQSSRLENVPGFPVGIAGNDLAKKASDQAAEEGTEIRTGVMATGLEHDDKTGLSTVTLSTGEKVSTRTVVLAGGVQFKKMDFPGSEGPGVSVGDPDQVAKDAKGGVALVIGGSNGAAQACLGICQTAEHVYLLSRSPLADKMSDVPRKTVLANSKITAIEGDEIDHLERDASNNPQTAVLKSGTRITVQAVGGFIGSVAKTDWLPPSIERNKAGFVVADTRFRTSVPGVFAIGDVREGGPQRVLSSAAEGQQAVASAFEYWAKAKTALDKGDPAPDKAAWQRTTVVPRTEYEAMKAELARLKGTHDADDSTMYIVVFLDPENQKATDAFDPDEPRDKVGKWTEFGGGGGELLHGTTADNLKSILKSGIRVDGKHQVWTTNSFKIAADYASLSTKAKKAPIILEVSVPKDHAHDFTNDPGFSKTAGSKAFFGTKTIPAKWIVGYYNVNRKSGAHGKFVSVKDAAPDNTKWNDLVDELLKADLAHPYVVQMIEGQDV